MIGSLLDNIRVFAKSVTIPNSASEPIIHSYMGERTFHAGKESSSHTVTVTFWDEESGTIRRYLDQWYKMTHDNYTGDAVNKVNYQRTMKIYFRDSSDTIYTGLYELTGVYPIDIGEIALNYDSSEVIEIPVTFQFDTKRMIT